MVLKDFAFDSIAFVLKSYFPNTQGLIYLLNGCDFTLKITSF